MIDYVTKSRVSEGLRRFSAGLISLAFGGIFFLTVVFGSWYTVDQTERAVVLRNGAIAREAQPGLHFKLPLIESVVRIPTKTNTLFYQKQETYSRDQQPTDIDLSVTYHVPADQVQTVYAQFGDTQYMINSLISPRVIEQLKNIFGTFDAVTAIQERTRLNAEVSMAIAAAIRGPVVIDSVQIQNITFSDQYEASIEQRMQAQVEVQKLEQNLAREQVQAKIVVTQATAQADAVKAKADADAYATRINGEAMATAIKARGAALRDNPNLVSLTQAERWNGVLPTTMVPNGALPVLGVGPR